MSRVFKIRVWDAEENRWFYTVPGEPDNHNVLETWHFDEVESHGDRHIWEQYTGLKDKNGKEIYEGDIVGDYYDDEEVGYIVFEDGSYCVNWSINNEILNGDLSGYLIVIGNIHENPEFLEGKNEPKE